MTLENFLLKEFKNYKNSNFNFWADDLNNLLIDIKDNEEASDYIKRKADKLNKEYKSKIGNKDIKNFSVVDIINQLGWKHIILAGKSGNAVLIDTKNRNKPKEYNSNIYTKATITIGDILNDKKDDKIKELLTKIKELYPTIKKVKVVDKEHKKKIINIT